MTNSWEQLPTEKKKEYSYFIQYLSYNGYDIQDFHSYLKANQNPTDKKLLKLQTLRGYASKNKWKDRKCDYQLYRHNEQFERMIEKEFEIKEKHFNKKVEATTKMLDSLITELNNGELTGYQANQWSQAISKLKDDNRLDIDAPTSITITDLKAEVEAEVTTTESVFDEVDEFLGLKDIVEDSD